jgi:esterase/lipase
MGISLGSVPTVHIAVKKEYQNVKGIVLISPIASGIKLVDPKLTITTVDLEKVDVFCNLSKVSNIQQPVFLIHGLKDDVIPHSQSLEMMNKIKHVYEWFPSKGTHSNIITDHRSKFFSKIKIFLEHLDYSTKPRSRGSDFEFESPSFQEFNRISIYKIKSKNDIFWLCLK